MSIPNIDTPISTGTILSYNADGTVNINTRYLGADSLPNIVSTFVALISGNTLGVGYKEGELIMYLKNSPGSINAQINDRGELILYTSTGDATNYSVDTNENLSYNKVT